VVSRHARGVKHERPIQLHGAGSWGALVLAEALITSAERLTVLDEPALIENLMMPPKRVAARLASMSPDTEADWRRNGHAAASNGCCTRRVEVATVRLLVLVLRPRHD
jgi:hypothetical protein